MVNNTQTTWDYHKATIEQLYPIKTLQQVMDEMKERHGFTATYGLQEPIYKLRAILQTSLTEFQKEAMEESIVQVGP